MALNRPSWPPSLSHRWKTGSIILDTVDLGSNFASGIEPSEQAGREKGGRDNWVETKSKELDRADTIIVLRIRDQITLFTCSAKCWWSINQWLIKDQWSTSTSKSHTQTDTYNYRTNPDNIYTYDHMKYIIIIHVTHQCMFFPNKQFKSK